MLNKATAMLQNLWHQVDKMNTVNSILISLLITGLATGLLYVFLFYILRPIFRQFERDIALVSLGVSAYPVLILLAIFSLRITFKNLVSVKIPTGIEHILTSIIITVISYWSVQLFLQVFITISKITLKKLKSCGMTYCFPSYQQLSLC